MCCLVSTYLRKKVLLGMQSGEPFEAMPAGMIRSQQRQLFFKSNETLDLIAGSIRYLINQVGQTSASIGRPAGDVGAGAGGARSQRLRAERPWGWPLRKQRLQPYLDVPARQQLAKTRHLLVRATWWRCGGSLQTTAVCLASSVICARVIWRSCRWTRSLARRFSTIRPHG
jgi:hypothetical protein